MARPSTTPPPRPSLRIVEAQPDDGALIDAIANGETARAVALYDRLRPLVSRTIRRLAPRSVEHEDLVQQTFVELVTSLRERPQVRSLDAWATTISARTVLQRLRRLRLEDRFAAMTVEDADVLIDRIIDTADGQLLTSARRQALRKIATLLASLNQNRVQVFVLHDVHGFELKEIAEILGITVANAQSRLVRGRSDVHEALEKDPELAASLREEDSP